MTPHRRTPPRPSVAYMGPPSSYTHQAALQQFKASARFLPIEGIGGVFRAVAGGEADFGVVPVENSNEGMVSYTHDMFMDAGVRICAEVFLDIHHCLLSRGPVNTVRKVYSMPMVWGQCRIWLNKHLPGIEQADVYSTARGAELAAKEPGSAAIAGALAAKLYRLRTLARHIEDNAHNITRFLVIGMHDAPKAGHSKTSLLFSIKDRAGALYEALKPFRDARINLTRIESRPSRQKPWEYCFFVDFLGHAADPAAARAIRRLATHCNFVKVLGSYPNAVPHGK